MILKPEDVVRVQSDPEKWQLRAPTTQAQPRISREMRAAIGGLVNPQVAAAICRGMTASSYPADHWLTWLTRQALNVPNSTSMLVLVGFLRYDLGLDRTPFTKRHGLRADDISYLTNRSRSAVNALLSKAYN